MLAVNDDQWRRLYAAIGRPHLIEDPLFATMIARMQNTDAALAVLAEAMTEKTTAEWGVLFDKADIPNGPVNTIAALLEDDYLRETEFFIPTSYDGTPASIRLLAPALGEHTESVLQEAGLTREEIAQASGV